jgi:hypothetical protein
MHLDPQTQAAFAERLTLLRQVRDALLRTAPETIGDPVNHAMALRALDGDIGRYEAALQTSAR